MSEDQEWADVLSPQRRNWLRRGGLVVAAGTIAPLSLAQTAPVLMYYLLGQHQIDYARLMAAAVLLSIPIAVPFAFIQRYYRAGMTEGGLKG